MLLLRLDYPPACTQTRLQARVVARPHPAIPLREPMLITFGRFDDRNYFRAISDSILDDMKAAQAQQQSDHEPAAETDLKASIARDWFKPSEVPAAETEGVDPSTV